jgi:FkbM family methyltransferase
MKIYIFGYNNKIYLKMSCNIIQSGSDGLGHQLYGLFSIMLLDDHNNFYFDPISQIEKKYQIDHISGKDKKDAIRYIKKTMIEYIKLKKNKNKKKYSKIIHSHEVYKIPNEYEEDVLYSLDNAYYFEKCKVNKSNIEKISPLFYIHLPKNRLKEKSIVIHIRLGDSVDREGNKEFRSQLISLFSMLPEKYPSHQIYIHSDGIPDFLKKENNFIFFGRETSILNVISDLTNADILVCCVSALSLFSSFINRGSLIIIPDSTRQSVPERSIRIGDFIRRTALVKVGTRYGGWYIPLFINLDENSIIYSGGAGEDISFDLHLSDLYGSEIILIDPTKRASEHFKNIIKYYNGEKELKQFEGDIQLDYKDNISKLKPNLKKFSFLELGLWDQEKELKFYKPEDEKYVSHSLIDGMFSDKYEIVKVSTIDKIMKDLCHENIDLLKLDIEGAEVKVLNDMLDKKIYPTYLLIEFDLILKGKDNDGEGKKLIKRLEKYYKLLKNDNFNITFVLKNG